MIMATMDCEPVRSQIPEQRKDISRSGPTDWEGSERSIRGYAGLCASYGWPLTLFLHPYKLVSGDYLQDLGAYSAE